MGEAIDITGQKFGKITALYKTGSNIYGSVVWHCRCECGNERDYIGSELCRGRIKSCGCGRKGKHPQYKCVCEGCGKEFLSKNTFAKYCSEACSRKCRRQALIEDRPFSDITEKLICMYHAEGDKIPIIASELGRPEEIIRKTITKCKRNGLYAAYAIQSYKLKSIKPRLYAELYKSAKQRGR